VATIPDARQAIIPGTAHLPNMEKPDEFNRILLDFLHEATESSR
jgi:pimeloyl-ACP methyl ester carboxylesterase